MKLLGHYNSQFTESFGAPEFTVIIIFLFLHWTVQTFSCCYIAIQFRGTNDPQPYLKSIKIIKKKQLKEVHTLGLQNNRILSSFEFVQLQKLHTCCVLEYEYIELEMLYQKGLMLSTPPRWHLRTKIWLRRQQRDIQVPKYSRRLHKILRA